MRRLTMVACALLGALALTASLALAHDPPGGLPPGHPGLRLAAKICRAEALNDPAAFEEKYGPRPEALRNCVEDKLPQARTALRAAASQCLSERRDHPVAFHEHYGAGPRDAHALRRCVVMKLREHLGS